MMKGVIPIVIAVTLLLAIIVSSLYFITTLNIESSVGSVSYSTIDWIKLDKELDTLIYLCLKEGSQAADEAFVKKYEELKSTFTQSTDFGQVIATAELEANNTLRKRVLEVLGNWTILKEKEGYSIDFERIFSNYVVDFGKGCSNVYFRVKISNIHGDYRVFEKNLTVFFGLKLNYTSYDTDIVQLILSWLLGGSLSANFTFKFIIEAYMELNGNRMYFIPDTSTLDNLAYSFLAKFIEFIGNIFGIDLPTMTVEFLGQYYYGEGKYIAVYQIPIQGQDIFDLAYILALFIDTYNGRLGFTANINIDGLIARSATLITT